jgi:hypothetical protein
MIATTPQHGDTRQIDGVEMIFEGCGRCVGTGMYGPLSVDGGICFECRVYSKRTQSFYGLGGRWVAKADYDRRKHNRDLAAARRERKAAEAEAAIPARIAALIEAHPLLADMFAEGRDYSGITGDMRRRFERGTDLSAKQIAFAEKLITEEREVVAAEAAKPEVAAAPVGRVTVTGEIISVKIKHSDFGDTLRMTVKSAEGWRVNGTMPTSIAEATDAWNVDLFEELRGIKVEFVATVEASGDADFGFFKRPAKGRVL